MRAAAEQSATEPRDAVLLARIAAGDDEAFAALARRYQGRFYAVARRMLGEDAVQAAPLRIYRNASAYRDRWSGSTWLYRVLTNVCIDSWRKRRRLVESPDATGGAPDSGPADRLDVDRALAKLPAEARAILLLCYVEGLPYAEIARVRGISVNTVKTQLSRAKRLMRRHLSYYEDYGDRRADCWIAARNRTKRQPMPQRPTLMSARGMVVTEHYLSAEAGLRILHAGGNAFDAAIAATLAEGVLNPHMHTFGGELSALAYVASQRRVVAINGNTVAPRAATIEWFKAHDISLIPFGGVLAAGPPAIPHALLTVLAHFGTRSFAEVATPAIELAEGGFPLHPGLRGPAPAHPLGDFSLTGSAELFRRAWPSSAAVYLPGGRLPEVGERMRNPDLGRTFRRLIAAEERARGHGRVDGISAAIDAFYRGEIADIIAAHCAAHGGLLAREDLHAFRSRIEPAVSLDYRGYTVHKCGPWSQGPVFLQQLALLAGFDLRALGHNSADYVHSVAEAAKLAFADREQYYGDPGFVDVPLEALLSERYAAARRALIEPRRASLDQRPGDPRRGAALLTGEEIFAARDWGRGTVYVAAVDVARNMASFTPSGAWIPSSPLIEGLGFPLGTRVQTFYLDPRHPNALAPGKRPRTTLTPTLVLRSGGPAMVFGTQGGDQQDQWTLQAFLNLVEFGMEVQEAIEAARFSSAHFPSSFSPHGAKPGTLRVEGRVPEAVRADLAARGHVLEVEGDWVAGDVLAIVVDDERGCLRAGADPRGEVSRRMPSYAIGW